MRTQIIWRNKPIKKKRKVKNQTHKMRMEDDMQGPSKKQTKLTLEL